jgi:hypothetical protein
MLNIYSATKHKSRSGHYVYLTGMLFIFDIIIKYQPKTKLELILSEIDFSPVVA